MQTYRSLFGMREFRALFVTQCLTMGAASVGSLALGTIIYSSTGSPVLSALAMFGGPLVRVAATWFFAAASDLLRPRQALTAVAVVTVTADGLQAIPDLAWWFRFVLLALPWIVMSATAGSMIALVSDIVPRENFVFARSTMNIAVGVMQIAGYGLGGILLLSLRTTQLFMCAAGAGAIALIIIRAGVGDHPPRAAGPTISRSRTVNRQLVRSPVLRPVLLALSVPNGLIVGCEAMFVPFAGHRAGYLFAATAAGMLLGDIGVGRFLGQRIRDRLVEPLRILLAAPYLVFLIDPTVVVAAAIGFVASIGYSASLPLQERLVTHTSPAARGQVLGLNSTAMMAMQGVGAVLAGVLAQVFGATSQSAATAAGIMAATSLAVSAGLTPGLRRSRPGSSPGGMDNPVMDVTFTPATQDAINRARRHSYGDLLHRTARRDPGKLAVVAGDLRVSFAEFDVAANRCAHALAARGLAKGDRLALLSHNCWEYVVLVFATARLGVVLVPVNFMLGADEVAYILQHCGAKGIIAEDALAGTADQALQAAGVADPLKGWIGSSGASPAPGWRDIGPWWREGPEHPPQAEVGDDDPLRLMYTSGTESVPKGVMISSRSLIAQYVSCTIDGGMSGDDIELHSLPMYHCAQLDCFFSTDVYLGATSVILPGPDPAAILAAIEREKVTKLFSPPTVWISLLRHPDFDATDLSSLRKGYYGASPMPVEVLRELQRRLPGVQLWNFYGQTEMAPLATILRPHEQLERAGSAGRASLNVETRLVDDEDKPVPPGEIGEIVHRSPHAALGYYNDEAKTADTYRGGWFHSGDLGVMTEDGYLSVVDRKKDMIKTGGENVASREVEEAIYELDGVAEVAVFGIAHPHWIEAVTAVIVPKAGVVLTEEEVQAHAKARLAGFKRPKYVVFTDALPKNPSGKILKRDLRQRHARLAGGAS